ncbi:hypothetical protein SAMN05421748_107132 [Paractinoplanes atraurantiacus]|uniref:Uncharacterized protein n=1 Tax=Paractinoplanes atraurantiacus TaxID=1036182 RepID=A0A285IA24_9ACTN|nr:hypothetical protein SAMN05421748_107132 [Actinoplanes atraurantiacus]
MSLYLDVHADSRNLLVGPLVLAAFGFGWVVGFVGTRRPRFISDAVM